MLSRLFLLLPLSAFLASVPAYGFDDSVAAQDQSAEAQNDCAFMSPAAILIPEAYENYHFKSAQDNQATESASIKKSVELEIQSSGCVDGVGQTFVLKVQGHDWKQADTKSWSGLAREQLSALKTSKDGANIVRQMLEFLSRVPSYEHSAYQQSGGKIFICRDDSIPDQECAWTTGGGYQFEVKRGKVWTTITMSQYISG